MGRESAANKGYLREDFRLFHLRDRRELPVEAHYHEFDKVVLLYAGEVEYTVEGVAYPMQPGDILFIRHHDVHRPLISGRTEYERVIFWISPELLGSYREGERDLESAFTEASRRRACLYHPPEEVWERLRTLVQALEKNAAEEALFAGTLMRSAYFALLASELNRCVLRGQPRRPGEGDRQMDAVLRYIGGHLDQELTVDSLAAMCYLSRYYFMRRFKDATGYTVHGYIQLKRLTAAAELLSQGAAAGEAAARCGFGDYSTFLRAFRRQYGVTPGDFARQGVRSLDSRYRE